MSLLVAKNMIGSPVLPCGGHPFSICIWPLIFAQKHAEKIVESQMGSPALSVVSWGYPALVFMGHVSSPSSTCFSPTFVCPGRAFATWSRSRLVACLYLGSQRALKDSLQNRDSTMFLLKVFVMHTLAFQPWLASGYPAMGPQVFHK